MPRITTLPIATTITNNGTFLIVDQGTSKQISWQTLKSGAFKGDTGSTGTIGLTGPRGPTGTVATIIVGTVSAGTTASVTATTLTTTTNTTVRLDFIVPIGPKGDTGTYILPFATTSTLGGVRAGNGLDVSGDGVLSVNTGSLFTLTTATTSTLGGVKIGVGISIDSEGAISATTATQYVLPVADGSTLGGVKIGAGIGLGVDGTISVTTGAFALQTATSVVLGGVKIGSGINVTSSGTISVAVLGTATNAVLGGVKIGSNINASADGTISVSAVPAADLTGTVLASNIIDSSLTSLGTLTSLNVGGVATLTQTAEVYTNLNLASGTVTHDCSSGTVFVHTGPTSNWTAAFTNVTTQSNRIISVALIVNQGSTARIPNALSINGSSQTINWQGGITPTGNANKKDLISFTFVSSGTSVYTVLGSLASFG